RPRARNDISRLRLGGFARAPPSRKREDSKGAFMIRFVCTIALTPLLPAPPVAQKSEPGAPFAGEAQRTGNTGGQAGPRPPKVVWVHKSRDHNLSSPVIFGDRLLLTGLTGFNLGYINCLSTEPAAKERIVWSKTTPMLKLPTVSSPAVLGPAIVFGDGMHQTS